MIDTCNGDLKSSSRGAMHPLLLLVVVAAALLHVYQFAVSDALPPLEVIAWSAWSLTPYVVCLLVAWVSISSIPACVGASVALFFDIMMHIAVVTSKSSTAGLGFIFMPLWNLVLIAPLAMLLAWFVRKVGASSNAS